MAKFSNFAVMESDADGVSCQWLRAYLRPSAIRLWTRRRTSRGTLCLLKRLHLFVIPLLRVAVAHPLRSAARRLPHPFFIVEMPDAFRKLMREGALPDGRDAQRLGERSE